MVTLHHLSVWSILKYPEREILQPFRYLATCAEEIFSSISNKNSKWSNLWLLLLVLSLGSSAKSLALSLCSSPIRCLEPAVDLLFTFISHSRTHPGISVCSHKHSCRSTAVLVALHCTCFSMSMPLLSWVPPKRHHRHSLRSTEQRAINAFQTSSYAVFNTTYLICPKIPDLICPWPSWVSVRSFSSLSRFFEPQLLPPMSYCLQTCWERTPSHHPDHE